MITLTTEQAQQIEEALEDIVRVFKFETGTPVEALAAIRAARALGQTEQEPVAFRFPRDTESWTGGWTIDYKVIRSVDAEIEDNEFKPCLESVEQVLLALEKVYAAPVRTKDLTEAEIDEIWKKHSGGNLGFAYAVIAADREKNKC